MSELEKSGVRRNNRGRQIIENLRNKTWLLELAYNKVCVNMCACMYVCVSLCIQGNGDAGGWYLNDIKCQYLPTKHKK